MEDEVGVQWRGGAFDGGVSIQWHLTTASMD
jgi:hypothetical protein